MDGARSIPRRGIGSGIARCRTDPLAYCYPNFGDSRCGSPPAWPCSRPQVTAVATALACREAEVYEERWPGPALRGRASNLTLCERHSAKARSAPGNGGVDPVPDISGRSPIKKIVS